jgi:hypothetical protein
MGTPAFPSTIMKAYPKFALMIGVSTVVMFGLMYLNTYSGDHVFLSETRVYMAVIMGATMGLLMMAFMHGMYKDRKMNALIVGTCVAVLGLALWLVRSQRLVEDVAWMKGMIPHHSIAILTSERAQLSDARVRGLAKRIVNAQRSEIEEMKGLIRDIESKGQAERAE